MRNCQKVQGFVVNVIKLSPLLSFYIEQWTFKREKIMLPWKILNLKKYIASVFIIVSCLELTLGIIHECKYEIPGRRVILWFFFLIYVIAACCSQYTKTEKLILAVLLLIGVMVYYMSGINTGIKAPIYIFALKGIDVKRLYHRMTQTLIIVISGIIIANLTLGIGTSMVHDIRPDRGFGGIRYCLGFSNPNRLQIMIFSVMVYVLWIWHDKLTIPFHILIGILYFISFIVSGSYTGLLLGLFIYAMSWLLTYAPRKQWRHVLAGGICVSYLCCLVISVFAAAGYRGEVMQLINRLISERMNQLSLYNNEAIHLTGEINNWTLFSSRLHKNVYDMGYIQLFYYYGIVPAVCYLLFVLYAVYKAWKRNDIIGSMAIWGFILYLFMEAAFFSNYLQSDFLLMTAAGLVMWEKNNEKTCITGDI